MFQDGRRDRESEFKNVGSCFYTCELHCLLKKTTD
jgi:hypothetical protein